MTRKTIRIHGESFTHDTEEELLEFRIRTPWITAGKKFGWVKPTLGIGLSLDALKYCLRNNIKNIRVLQDSRIYETTPTTWLNFTHEHNSIDVRGENTILYIMQFSSKYFTRILEEN